MPRVSSDRASSTSAGPWTVLAGAVLLLLAAPAGAQASRASGITVLPSLSVTETLTDNHRNSVLGVDDWESITTVGGTVRIAGRSGRIRADVDYGLTGVIYGRDTSASSLQNRLDGVVQGEVIPQHLDVTLTGNISRQARSAFGRQSVDGTTTELNQTQVRSFSVSPRLRGVVGGVVAAQATLVATKNSSQTNLGTEEYTAALNLSPVSSRPRLGWAADLSSQRIRYDSGATIDTDRGILSLLWRPDVDLQFVVRGGQEYTNLVSLRKQRYDNYGVGLAWTPSPRTLLSLDADERSFGRSHAIAAEHRMRRVLVRYSDSQSVSTDSSQSGVAGITAYDLFFALFAAQYPNPEQLAERDAAVRDYLATNGIDPNTVLASAGFVTSTATLQRRKELSLAIAGQRTSFVLSAYETRDERLDRGSISLVIDDTLVGPVNQKGLRFTASHSLNPTDSLVFRVSTMRSRGDAGDPRTGGLDSVSLSWSTRLSARSSFSLTGQHAESNQITDPYTENSVTAAFFTRF